jgi:hypothetical protein
MAVLTGREIVDVNFVEKRAFPATAAQIDLFGNPIKGSGRLILWRSSCAFPIVKFNNSIEAPEAL